jgi:hypothetical protein
MNSKFLDILNNDFDVISSKVNTAIQKHFPNGYINIQKSTLGPTISMGITFAIGKRTEWINGIIQNDPHWCNIWIHSAFDKTTSNLIKPEITLNSDTAGYIYTRKTGKLKIGWRDVKKPSTVDKVITTIDVYFSKLKKVYDENF